VNLAQLQLADFIHKVFQSVIFLWLPLVAPLQKQLHCDYTVSMGI